MRALAPPFPGPTRPSEPRRKPLNNYQSQNVVYGQAWAATLTAALKTAPANPLVNTAKIRLSSQNGYNPQVNSTIASLAANEASYSGYPAGGIAAVLTAGLNLSGNCEGAIAQAVFEATAATPFVPGVVYGYWVDDGTNVILGEAFAGGGSAGFNIPGAFLTLAVLFPTQLLQACQ